MVLVPKEIILIVLLNYTVILVTTQAKKNYIVIFVTTQEKVLATSTLYLKRTSHN